MPKVNPEILRWARETSGLSIEEASKKLNISKAKDVTPAEKLIALEKGEIEPPRTLLIKMAKQYHRSLITFYMEYPPRKADRGQDFRTLPDTYTDFTKGLIDALIRDVKVRQNIIRSALEDEEESHSLTFVGSSKISDGRDRIIQSIYKTIDCNLQKFRDQPSSEDAFKYMRRKVEESGVFVLLIGDLGSHHSAFDIDVFRGIALSDDIAPFIVINDHDSKAAWSFTLIHELTHIWLGQTGISNEGSELEVEHFCNNVASEFLLPEKELDSLIFSDNLSFEEILNLISDFAYSKNISSSMVAYKLYLQGKIERSIWKRLSISYRRLWKEAKDEEREKKTGKNGGPTYYTVRRHRLGDNLISLVKQMVVGGTLTTSKAGKVLGVAPKNVANLLGPSFQLTSRHS